jgi:hypothetical protein
MGVAMLIGRFDHSRRLVLKVHNRVPSALSRNFSCLPCHPSNCSLFIVILNQWGQRR